ncbi:MAG: hypothetical protein VX642_14395, partial [Bdellovibrionota bacterium]|nr:hypothetical protein [Bdellovibrionota bacterium]
EQAILNSKENLKKYSGISNFVVASATDSILQFSSADLILSNPPYDERMKFSKSELRIFLQNLMNSKAKSGCLLVPRQRRDFCLQFIKDKSCKILNFKNAAIPVSLVFWTQSN